MRHHLKVKDVMEDLGIRESYAYKLIDSPGFPTIRIPSMGDKKEREHIRIPADRYEEWKREHMKTV